MSERERERFEKWYADKYFRQDYYDFSKPSDLFIRHKGAEHRYVDGRVERCWQAWQAALVAHAINKAVPGLGE